MTRALALDLRVRVLAAVSEGMSHRAAGDRFDVSAASVSRWRGLERDQGDPSPKPSGGDRRSHRIEAHRDVILSLVEETPDCTIEELRAVLADRGLHFGYGTLWRFLARHEVTLKKSRRTPPSRTDPM